MRGETWAEKGIRAKGCGGKGEISRKKKKKKVALSGVCVLVLCYSKAGSTRAACGGEKSRVVSVFMAQLHFGYFAFCHKILKMYVFLNY